MGQALFASKCHLLLKLWRPSLPLFAWKKKEVYLTSRTRFKCHHLVQSVSWMACTSEFNPPPTASWAAPSPFGTLSPWGLTSQLRITLHPGRMVSGHEAQYLYSRPCFWFYLRTLAVHRGGMRGLSPENKVGLGCGEPRPQISFPRDSGPQKVKSVLPWRPGFAVLSWVGGKGCALSIRVRLAF